MLLTHGRRAGRCDSGAVQAWLQEEEAGGSGWSAGQAPAPGLTCCEGYHPDALQFRDLRQLYPQWALNFPVCAKSKA